MRSKAPTRNGYEVDIIAHRRHLKLRTGEAAATKRRMRRRHRRASKQALHAGRW